MVTKKPRSPKMSEVTVPASYAEVCALHNEISRLVREIEHTEAETSKAIMALEASLTLDMGPKVVQVLSLAKQVHAYAAAHRIELTDGGKTKTAQFGNSGDVRWATSPAAVHLREPDKVLTSLKKLGFADFIRNPPPEIDKDAMLANIERARQVPGVSISQAEKVYVHAEGIRAWVESTIGKKDTPGAWTIKWPKAEKK